MPYTAHVKNEVVLGRMSENRELINIIRSQQMKSFGHILRNKEIEDTIVTGKNEGKQDRGKQRLTFTKSLSNWMRIEGVEMIRASQDRQKWSVMTSQVWIRQGT